MALLSGFMLSLLSISLHGQDRLRFNRLTQQDGLRQGMIYSVVQDGSGFLWIATKGGLHRWDGKNFLVYRHDPEDEFSIQNELLLDIERDENGNLWMLSGNGRICWYDRFSNRFHYLPKRIDEYTERHEIHSILYDDRGFLWLLTLGNGLHLYDISRREVSPVLIKHDGKPLLTPGNYSTETIILENGNLLIPVPEGHLLIENPLGARQVKLRKLPDEEGFSVTNYAEDTNGDVYFYLKDQGIYRLSRDIESVERLSDSMRRGGELLSLTAADLQFDRNGDLWIATPSGLLRCDRKNGVVTQYQHDPADQFSPVMNSISLLYLDDSETLWLGSPGKGLSSFSWYNNKFKVYTGFATDNPAGDFVYSIDIHGDQTIWAGLTDGMVLCIDARSANLLWKPALGGTPEQPNAPVMALAAIDEHRVLAGTSAGLYLLNKEDKTLTNILADCNINSLVRDNQAQAIHVMGDRILKFSTPDLAYSDVRIPGLSVGVDNDDEIIVAAELTDRTLWMISRLGTLIRYQTQTGDVEIFHLQETAAVSPGPFRAYSIAVIGSEEVWIGCDSGLLRFNPLTGKHTTLTMSDGLPDNTIYAILKDRDTAGLLWCSSNQGILSVDTRTLETAQLTTADGLPSNEFNRGSRAMADDGTCYFGGVNGFISFQPSNLRSNPYPPKVAITGIKTFDHDLETDVSIFALEELSLGHEQNFFSLEFAALDLAFPSRNRYRYRLHGFDGEWVSSGTRSEASYTNVPPGEYEFQVTGSNHDGVWSEDGARLQITIVPPFWRTPAFYILIALSVLAVIAAAHWYRTASIVKQRNLLRAEVEERRKVEQNLIDHQQRLRSLAGQVAIAEEEERRRIAMGMHDTVGQNLAFAKRLLRDVVSKHDVNPDVLRQLEEAMTLLADSISETKSLTFQLSPPVLYELGFISAVHWLADNLISKHGTAWDIKTSEQQVPLSDQVAVQLFQCVRETLINVVKHAEAQKVTIAISSYHEKGTVQVRVEDNGRGFDKEAALTSSAGPQGYGLLSLEERMAYFGGTVTIHSTPGKGTTVLFKAPLRNDSITTEKE